MKEGKYRLSGFAEQVLLAITPPTNVEMEPTAFRIDVHAAVSRFAVLYERIRNAVDYKDEHLLRRAAILRILKRQLLLETDSKVVAQNLIRELIGARYLPNGELPESILVGVAARIQKVQTIERMHAGSARHLRWVLRLLSAELEESLVDSSRDKALAMRLYEKLVDRIRVSGATISEDDIRVQVYVACTRAMQKADEDMLAWKLTRVYLPEWLHSEEWIANPASVAERLVGVERRIRQILTHPLGQKIQRAIKPWAVSLSVLRDALLEKPEDAAALLADSDTLKAYIGRRADRQYRLAKAKLRRGAVRAILYIFLTKMLVAFVLEVPIEQLVYGFVSYPILAVNLLFPPVLMAIVALCIRVPGKENTERLQQNVAILLSSEPLPVREIRVRPARTLMGTLLFGLAYLVLYVITFGFIALLLLRLHFTPISIFVFLFFLCTVSFFAFRLRQNARELVIVNGREHLRSIFVDALSLPILRVGLWLSRGISRINVFLFFFDFLLEAPFKLFLTILEEWFTYLKEKKEGLQ